jgi:hypothetical protein
MHKLQRVLGNLKSNRVTLTLTFFLLKALVSDAIQDDLQDDSLYLPPCHADAAKPEDVYKFEDSILSFSRNYVCNFWIISYLKFISIK